MTPLLLVLAAIETSALIICAINCPGYTLAAFLVVASVAALVCGTWLWQAARASKQHDEEQGLR